MNLPSKSATLTDRKKLHVTQFYRSTSFNERLKTRRRKLTNRLFNSALFYSQLPLQTRALANGLPPSRRSTRHSSVRTTTKNSLHSSVLLALQPPSKQRASVSTSMSNDTTAYRHSDWCTEESVKWEPLNKDDDDDDNNNNIFFNCNWVVH